MYQVTRYLPRPELAEIEAWLTARCVPYEVQPHETKPARFAIYRTDMRLVRKTPYEGGKLVEEEPGDARTT